jgi:hypothetical protein
MRCQDGHNASVSNQEYYLEKIAELDVHAEQSAFNMQNQ